MADLSFATTLGREFALALEGVEGVLGQDGWSVFSSVLGERCSPAGLRGLNSCDIAELCRVARSFLETEEVTEEDIQSVIREVVWHHPTGLSARRLIELFEGRSDVWIAGPASEEDVVAVEAALGVKLPADFKEFLRIAGAGGPSGSEISGVIVGDDGGGSLVGDTRAARASGLPGAYVVLQLAAPDEFVWALEFEESSGQFAGVVGVELTPLHLGERYLSFSDWLERYYVPSI